MDDLIAELNLQQQQAVMCALGPVLVLAGPGSGKTRVLTQRIAYLIGQMGVSPYNILAVTFTNKAAREMENRVTDLLSGQVRGITLGTFHAICARILRREAEHLPVTSSFVIFDEDDQLQMVKQAIRDLNLDDKRYTPRSVHAGISNAKNELICVEKFPVNSYRDEVIKRVYRRYQELLLAGNGVDFDDLLLYTANLLEEHPDVCEKYAHRFEYILVDEFQDTNMAQYKLLKHLASFHRNIFVVGDMDQSIYRWRGADYRNLMRFERDYPDTQVILLEQNYRSTQNILDAAMGVIDRNPDRTPKQLFTERGSGASIVLYEAFHDHEEAAFAVNTIANLVARKQARPGDFAIMYRTNAQSRVLEEAFLYANLPYHIVGAQRFYGRREIKDLIAYLRLAHNPKDEISLLRVINTPPRKIGMKTVEALRTQSQRMDLSPGELLLKLHQDAGTSRPEPESYQSLSGRAITQLVSFGDLLAGWRGFLAGETGQTPSPLQLLDRILEDVDYRSYIDDGTEEGQSRWENVLELRRLAAENRERDLASFLEQIALVSDQDTLETSSNVPTLLTLHAAKGLEFPIVFIVGLNDGVLPHNRSLDDAEEMMEERRLFYVGITRAKDRLYLLYSQQRNTYGYPDYAEPSRFLEDIPSSLLAEVQPERSATEWSPSKPIAEERWESIKPADGAPGAKAGQEKNHKREGLSSYPPSTRVHHPMWGEGLVLNCQNQDGDEVLDIFFEGVGLKRVMASLARLQIKT